MIPDPSRRAGLHPSLVLSAYAEPLCRGRRVAILGDATIGLADELIKRGARMVHAYDPNHARTAEAIARLGPGRGHQITIAVLADDFGVRDGAFDLVILPDLGLFADPGDMLRRTRRLVSPTGAALIVATNAKTEKTRLLPQGNQAPSPVPPPGYYELYDLVSLQFSKVRMLGQAPFVGYTVAEFAHRGEPSVSVDTSLLEASEEPEHFIAIASDRALMLDPYAVIELPWGEISATLGRAAVDEESLAEQRLALTEAQTRLALANTELEKLREKQQHEAREVEGRNAASTALSARVLELELEISTRDARIKEIEGRAGDNHVRAERLAQQVRELEEELRRQRDRGTKLTKQLEDEKKGRTRAEIELGMLRGKPELPGAKERLEVISMELEAARSRINELEMEHAETRRQGAISAALPPATTPPDTAIMDRMSELEIALHATRRELSEAMAMRDAAENRARKASTRASETDAIAAELAAAQRNLAELEERLRESERLRVDAERRVAEAHRQIASLEERLDEARRAAPELEKRLGDSRLRLAELEKRLAEEEPRRTQLEQSLADARDRIAELEGHEEVGVSAVSELNTLEAALRERGRVVTALSRDLRESERVGKELLAELLSLQGKAAASSAPGGDGGGEDLRSRLDTLAASAARCEADLQAANWRVAQLERELDEVKSEAQEPSAIQVELEQALAAARSEVASRREALAAQGEAASP